MPIYEYECINCGKHYEVMQKFSDEPLTLCTICKGPLHKLISQTSFVLKGTGWYVTDYASSDRKQKEKESRSKGKSAPVVTNGESKAQSKTETKPQSNTETKPEPAAKS
ncbi:MAG: zinc ribbon domain-containing protein [Thermodesulfovibrionales bacterium]|nr:zinc ribbon domain-containing protein [Thermodesulfovibrionales bacterium]